LCAVLIGLTVGAASLSAARRVYESRQPLEQTVAAMMEQMSEAGLKISIRKVYDIKADGKQGFVLYLAPRNSLCEITFRGDPGNASRSVVSVFTEDARDAGVFHDFFTGRMGLKEVGVNEDFDDSNPWPVPVR
jgi:hypothetical protein